MNHYQGYDLLFYKEPVIAQEDCFVWCPDFCPPRIAIATKNKKVATTTANRFFSKRMWIAYHNINPNKRFIQARWGRLIPNTEIKDQRVFPLTTNLKDCYTIELKVTGFIPSFLVQEPIKVTQQFLPTGIGYEAKCWSYSPRELRLMYESGIDTYGVFRFLKTKHQLQANIRIQLEFLYKASIHDLPNSCYTLFDPNYFRLNRKLILNNSAD
jgi:hypothetical protein